MRARALPRIALFLLLVAAWSLPVRAQETPPEDRWFGLWLQETRVGTVHFSMTAVREEGKPAWEVKSTMEMRMRLQHGESKRRQEESGVFRADYTPLRTTEVSEDNGERSSKSTTFSATEAVQEQTGGGRTATVRVPLDGPVAADDEMELRRVASTRPLAVGQRHVYRRVDFDARKLFRHEAHVAAAADLPGGGKGFRVLFTNEGRPDMTLTALVDPVGRFLQIEFGPLIARTIEAGAAAIPESSAVAARSEVACVPAVAPEHRERIRALTIAVDFLAESAGEFPTNGYQESRREGKSRVLTLTANRPATSPELMLPVADPAVALFLKATPEIQSDAPEVRQRAREILGAETRAEAAAEKLCRWVFENMAKQHDAAALSSAESLRRLQGNCTEHAAAFVGLARAAGLPARMAGGLAFSNSSFTLHAWAEAWVGTWLPVDPSFGSIGTGPLYISFGASSDADGVEHGAGLQLAFLGALRSTETRIRILALDLDGQRFDPTDPTGMLPVEAAEDDPAPQRVTLASGLEFDGDLAGLKSGKLVFRTPYGRTAIARADLDRVQFGERAVRGSAFRDRKLGIAFRVPAAGWTLAQSGSEGGVERYLFTAKDGEAAGLFLSESGTFPSLYQYLQSVQGLPGTKGAQENKVEPIEVGAGPNRVSALAWRFLQAKPGASPLRFQMLLWRWRGRFYRMAFWSAPERSADLQPVFDGIRDSIELLGEKE